MSHLPPLPGSSREFVPNHLVWAILTTLFCCLPLGIVSIIHAAQVDGKRAAGDMRGARESSDKAKFWAILSACLMLVPMVLYLLFILVVAGTGVLGGLGGVN